MSYPNFQQSPLLLHQPALTPNPNSSFGMPSSPSRSASPSVFNPSVGATPPGASPYQIPFNVTPVHHAPSPLGFGFGFGSSFGNNNPQAPSHFHASAASASSTAATTALAHSFASPTPASASPPKRSDAKRRRDPDQDDEEMDHDGPHPSLSPKLRRGETSPRFELRRQVAPKRMRAGLGQLNGPLFAATSSSSRSGSDVFGGSAVSSSSKAPPSPRKNVMSGVEVDLGKMLASMDKASLLSMLMNLLAQSKDPELGSQILSLLPTPSLESVEAALDQAEKNIRSAIPFATQAGGAGVRDEYTWSRVRAPIAAFVDAALGYLPFFVTELDGSNSSGRDGVHPATTFTLLQALTLRALRIHALLPPVPKSSLTFSTQRSHRSMTSFGFGSGVKSIADTTSAPSTADGDKHADLTDRLPSQYTSPSSPDALVSTLMPALLKQWTVWLQRLDKAVNVEGRMFGQEVVLGWARALDAVGTRTSNTSLARSQDPKAEEVAIRQVMDEVRNRLERDLGWLVGGNGPAQRALQTQTKRSRTPSMDDEEEL